MSEQILDLTHVARRRKRVCDHDWQAKKNGAERCVKCDDHFPCRGACAHLDCILRACELGFKRDIPDDVLGSLKILNPSHAGEGECHACEDDLDGHYELWIDSSAPTRMWVLPNGWKVVAA